MGQGIDDALAEVSGRVGVDVPELYDWLQSEGLEAYGRSQVAMYACWTAMLLMAWLIGMAMMMLYACSTRRDCLMCDEACVVGVVVALASSVGLAYVVPELAGWLTSPEGMIMRLVIGRW